MDVFAEPEQIRAVPFPLPDWKDDQKNTLVTSICENEFD